MSTEVALSKDSLQSEGIELKLTQSDIIEMLVEDQVKSITEIGEKIINNQKQILELVDKEWKDAIDKHIKKLVLPKGLTIITHSKNFNTLEKINISVLRDYVDGRNGTITYNSHTTLMALNCKANVTLTYEATVSKVKMIGYSEPISFNFKHSKKVTDLITEHNEKVTEFLAIIPPKGINEKEIAKIIKNRLTKEMIKNMNPDLQKALKKGFGVTL